MIVHNIIFLTISLLKIVQCLHKTIIIIIEKYTYVFSIFLFKLIWNMFCQFSVVFLEIEN